MKSMTAHFYTSLKYLNILQTTATLKKNVTCALNYGVISY